MSGLAVSAACSSSPSSARSPCSEAWSRPLRWRPDRDAASCGFAQLEQPVGFDVAEIL